MITNSDELNKKLLYSKKEKNETDEVEKKAQNFSHPMCYQNKRSVIQLNRTDFLKKFN